MLTLDHVVFPVRDAEATLKFYTEVLGLPLVEVFSGDDWDGYPWLMMMFGLGGRHELVAVALKGAAGVAYWEENHGEQASIYFPDPDEVILEITWPASSVRPVADPEAADAVRRWARGAA